MKKVFTKFSVVKERLLILNLICIGLFGQACSKVSSNVSANAPAPFIEPSSVDAIYSFKSVTTGGGDMAYEITDEGDHYKIHVTRYQFKSFLQDAKVVTVSKASQSQFGARLAGELDVIYLMGGSCVFKTTNDSSDCPGCLSGSWTSQSIKKQKNASEVQVFGLINCRDQVNETAIRDLIVNELSL